MGERLRAERRSRGLSLRALADRLGVSPSLISQIETGRAMPSVSTLYAIANELAVSVDALLFNGGEGSPSRDEPRTAPTPDPEAASSPVLRAAQRKSIRLASGVVWQLLTQTSNPSVEFLFVTYEVGGASSPKHEFQRHNGVEWGYVLSGRLGVTIAFDDYVLEAGDSVTLDSTLPHRLYNLGGEPVQAVWFVVGRRSLEEPSAHRS
jgi:transcriptional regulator with XRE-family HTH domain